MKILLKIGFVCLTVLSQLSCDHKQTSKGDQGFIELADPTADTLSDWSAVKPGLHSSFVSIDKRFARSVAPDLEAMKKTTLKGWKGERLSAQILLWTSADLADVRVDVGEFKSLNNNDVLAATTEASFVRYVMTDEFAAGCGHRKPQDFAASLSADMLDNLSTFTIEGKQVRPVWISLDIPREGKAGVYQSEVTIRSGNKALEKLNIDLEVVNEVLPAVSEWTFHLDQWQHPSAVARVENVEIWSDEHFKALEPVMKRLASAGQKVITTTLNKDPWNVQTFDPYADMIIWTKKVDGTWDYDYQVFDKWVSFMMDLGVNKMINCYSIIPWNNMIHYKDENTNEFIDVEAKPGTDIFKEMWTPFLQSFADHLQSKGWLEITNIAIDEREPEQMEAAFALLKEVVPVLGISYADNQKTYRKFPDSEDISIAVGHPYSKQDIADRKARGLNSTFYICCSDEFPNQFTFSEPAESTYLGWYALASGFDGLLRWAYNSWVENPLQDSRFRTWPAGDTYIVYPQGRSSIRFERMLEGIQDYEKVQVLRKKWSDQQEDEKLNELNKAIQKLDNPKRTDTWNDDLNYAKALLN